MRYRKRPVVIEATQWWPGLDVDGVIVVDGKWQNAHIITLEGVMHVSPGDWIVTGVQQEKYPCKDEIFRATYEAVHDEVPA
jgi:hypothetical protein